MSEHHQLSPSTYNARVHCLHWMPSDTSSDEATVGTHNHSELEKGLRDLEYEPNTYVARWARDMIVHLAMEYYSDKSISDIKPEVKLTGTLLSMNGIYGTADAMWTDEDGNIHVADLKTFSDGTEDYSYQLKGYIALWATKGDCLDRRAFLHVLHGGITSVETIETSVSDCVSDIDTLISKIKSINDDNDTYHLNHYCKYCSKIKECPMANNAIEVVNGNGAVDFSKLSLPEKLVICDAVEKLIKSLKDDAKAQAIANGGVLEDGNIKYEIKERAGKGRVHDLCELAAAVAVPSVLDKDGVSRQLNGLTSDELIRMCELPKTAFVNKMKEINADNKSIKKKDIEMWCGQFFDKGEPSQYLTRVK